MKIVKKVGQFIIEKQADFALNKKGISKVYARY